MAVDLDAIEAALAKMTPGPWDAFDHPDDVASIVERATGETVAVCDAESRDDESVDPIADAAGIALLRNAAPAMAAEIRTLRSDLAAANLREANARSVAVEAIDLATETLDEMATGVSDDSLTPDRERLDALRTRLVTPADFAARVTAALDRLVEVAASEFPGSAKVDAARSEVDAAIGVAK